MSKSKDFYHQESNKRTLEKIKEYYKTRQYSCEHYPLLNIELDNVVLDELHLMLRVTGTNQYKSLITINTK